MMPGACGAVWLERVMLAGGQISPGLPIHEQFVPVLHKLMNTSIFST